MLLEHLYSKKAFFLCMVVFSSFFKTSKDDLLLTDFEGALKFFRVQLPKRYRSEENAKKLMELACNMKVKSFCINVDPFVSVSLFLIKLSTFIIH